MTHITTGERIGPQNSPYQAEEMLGKDLGLPVDGDVKVHVERWVEAVTDLDRANEIYNAYGAVILSPDTVLEMGSHDVQVGEFASASTDYVVEQLNDHPKAVRQKDYHAYNGTERHLFTVSPENVEEFLPEVLKMQRLLLPAVRAINGDPTTEISVDPDEGTVVNLQLFDINGDPQTRQQHGAHTDRVDTTTIVCLDNVGPHGELVFVEGYSAVCERLGLSPHRGFDHNIQEILGKEPDALAFRIHDVRPGTIVMVKSAEDVHFITAKTLDDVQKGTAEGRELLKLGDKVMGRGIINMAFETGECRRVDEVAQRLENQFRIQKAKSTGQFFFRLDRALASKDLALRKDVGNAIVTRRSASDLYQ